jgi:hypothetical protein
MNERYPCPCCGFLTLPEPASGTYNICTVCFWEDDPTQLRDPDYWGGANRLSLNDARENFWTIGAGCPEDVRHVRPPAPYEYPPVLALDLDAEVRPGRSAAGVLIGTPIDKVLTYHVPEAVEVVREQIVHGYSTISYSFGPVRVWADDGIVSQVGVYEGYRGGIGTIHIGSTVQELAEHFKAVVYEDIEDVLVVAGVDGFCVETEQWEGSRVEANMDKKITEMFVFAQGR